MSTRTAGPRVKVDCTCPRARHVHGTYQAYNTDLANIVLLCRDDHRWVTEHPVEAAAEGWVLRALVPEEASAW